MGLCARMAEAQSLFDGLNSSGSNRNPAAHSASVIPKGLQAVQPGSSESLRQQLFFQLLGTSTPQLQWPAFPRIWLERNKVESKTSNTSLGLKIPIISAGTKVSVHFRYGLKTSLVIMSSMRREGAVNQSLPIENGISGRSLTSDEATTYEILKWDENNIAVYPNVKEGYPMVGFCSFEASLTVDKHWEGGVDIFGSGQSFETNDVDISSYTLFSNFFQVDPNISVDSYINEVCNKIFRKEAEPVVINDFSKLVIEKVVKIHPRSDCKIVQQINTSVGDSTCLDWHREFSGPIQRMTMPRCELQFDGAQKCVLKAREGVSCPLYQNKDTKNLSEYITSRRDQKITESSYAYPCDQKSGLSCKLESAPTMLGGVVAWPGSARCSK